MIDKNKIIDILKQCFDPEIPIDLWSLGLIYNIDINEATSKGIIVMNVPDGNTVSAAEHTIAMLLALSRNIQIGHSSLQKGLWERSKLTGSELRGKTLGVVGLGKIGREVIKRALSFDMQIISSLPISIEIKTLLGFG